MKVLVTGGAGFIGSHIVDNLVERGHNVRVLDDLSSGTTANLSSHLKEGVVDFVKGNINDSGTTRDALKGIDSVIHLAALVSVPFSMKNPSATRAVNVDGTANVVESCRGTSVSRFVFVSSCAVYGESEYLPIDEAHPTNPISPYASSKLDGERQCRAYKKKGKLDVVILRLFNVYGPRQRGGDYAGVITSFLEKARKDLPLTVYGDGSQLRDFVYVQDIADAASTALEASSSGNGLFNIGYGKPVSINELAETVLKVSGKNLKILHEAPRPGDIKRSVADISKARRMLEYSPKFPLEKGLKNLLELQSGKHK